MKAKKRLAAEILNTSPYKVVFAADALDDIKKAITRSDFRGLIAVKKIVKSNVNQHSRAGARRILAQKKKGRQKGRGSRKGRKNALVTGKERWMSTVRIQRRFLKELKEKNLLSIPNYRNLYAKSKGGFFRNKRHIKLYLAENNLVEKGNKVNHEK
ncbi:MAG: 50S ribosomal protein L19e [Nanoarchaeota archaeon]|nr:50S ribosomal protein L19e [Nanoarchaeota archaeon]